MRTKKEVILSMLWLPFAIGWYIAVSGCKPKTVKEDRPPPMVKGVCTAQSYIGDEPEFLDCSFEGWKWRCMHNSPYVYRCEREEQTTFYPEKPPCPPPAPHVADNTEAPPQNIPQ